MQLARILIFLIILTYVQIIFSFETTDNTPVRPYFHHWQQTRDNSRYTVKNSLAFSPRLGKRADDLDDFLITLADQLQEKQIDIVYEDSTKICLSQPISGTFLQQILGQVGKSRRSQDETHGRQTIGKHPVLFRYRLG